MLVGLPHAQEWHRALLDLYVNAINFGVERFESRFARSHRVTDLGFALGLRFLFISGERLFDRLAILIEELGAEGPCPVFTLFGDLSLQGRDSRLHGDFLLLGHFTCRFDLALTVFLDDDSDIGKQADIVLIDANGQVIDSLPSTLGN